VVELGSLGAEHTAARFFENKTLESRGRSSHFLEKTRALNDGFGKKCFLVSASDVRVRRAVSMASKA
jgi:hypothetical protein